MGFIKEEVDQYITELLPLDDSFLEELQQQGIKEEIPIIQVPSMKLIQVLLNMIRPSNIIEVGTAIGFSTIFLAKSAPYATIHTIERNETMIARAKENFRIAGLDKQIILYEGDAIEILPHLPQSEFIFIDAAKGKYKQFLQLAFPLLPVGGIFVFDNILFRGYIAEEEIVQTKPMLKKLHRFNQELADEKKLLTSFVPIGDGLAISYKLEE
ncbi:putative O-methyltransferase YrrM [Tepidibacillus fermentans]|uniref:tRNA 5-hydroxyuridine methyltransferase n=2 Tax=Tepidibacillus fermentans TaxID=1281767 RepID=A0A4R3KLS5_9BACI|nr:putative O-methyltransferase YrrM [Tepidibacillus fermentans]